MSRARIITALAAFFATLAVAPLAVLLLPFLAAYSVWNDNDDAPETTETETNHER